MRHELALQNTSRLDEQAFVDRLMRHLHRPIIAVLGLQPSRYLLGRLLILQLRCDDRLQVRIDREQARLQPKALLPCSAIRDGCTIFPSSTITADFPTDRRRGATELLGNVSE